MYNGGREKESDDCVCLGERNLLLYVVSSKEFVSDALT